MLPSCVIRPATLWTRDRGISIFYAFRILEKFRIQRRLYWETRGSSRDPPSYPPSCSVLFALVMSSRSTSSPNLSQETQLLVMKLTVDCDASSFLERLQLLRQTVVTNFPSTCRARFLTVYGRTEEWTFRRLCATLHNVHRRGVDV